jgi:hypothetical protein
MFMGDLKLPRGVTPLVAILAGREPHFAAAKAPLEALLGPVELESEFFRFDKTEYYDATMGKGLLRQFLSFKPLADPAALVEWKLATNDLEAKLGRELSTPGGPERPINLDPGYIDPPNLVLASTKNRQHRIYLRNGIYAEITLTFQGDAWTSHRFTFPDFKSGAYDHFLKRVRDRHLWKVKQ